MQGRENYQYDFSYSLAFETKTPSCDFERLLLACGHLILRFKCLKDRQAHQIVAGLLKIPIYFKIGKCLFQICSIVHQLKTPSKKKEELERVREELYNYLKDLSSILSVDKDGYLPTVVAIYYVSIRKLLSSSTLPQNLNTYIFFHTIYWQIKGQITTNKFMENLLDATFKKPLLHEFQAFNLSQTDELNKIDEGSGKKGELPLSENKMLQSFKEIKLHRPDLILKEETLRREYNKQNLNKTEKKKKQMQGSFQVRSPKGRFPIKLIK